MLVYKRKEKLHGAQRGIGDTLYQMDHGTTQVSFSSAAVNYTP